MKLRKRHLEKIASLTTKSFEWASSYERLSNKIRIILKERSIESEICLFSSWWNKFVAWKTFSFDKKWSFDLRLFANIIQRDNELQHSQNCRFPAAFISKIWKVQIFFLRWSDDFGGHCINSWSIQWLFAKIRIFCQINWSKRGNLNIGDVW